MDRFFAYVLGVLLAVLAIALFWLYFPRERAPELVETTPTPSPTPALLDAAATPDPSKLFMSDPQPGTLEPAMPMTASLPWSAPNPGKIQTIIYPGFTVVYSETLGNPLAVQYAMVNGAKPKKYSEPLKMKTPTESALKATGYLPGPMALPESIDLYFGKAAGRNTRLMTNLCAFLPACLNGPWAEFAKREGKYAGEFGWIEVVAGPIFAAPPAERGGLVMPDAFYRAYRRSFGDTMAFIVPQTATGTDLSKYLTSIASIEAASGMKIFENTISMEERNRTAAGIWKLAAENVPPKEETIEAVPVPSLDQAR